MKALKTTVAGAPTEPPPPLVLPGAGARRPGAPAPPPAPIVPYISPRRAGEADDDCEEVLIQRPLARLYSLLVPQPLTVYAEWASVAENRSLFEARDSHSNSTWSGGGASTGGGDQALDSRCFTIARPRRSTTANGPEARRRRRAIAGGRARGGDDT